MKILTIDLGTKTGWAKFDEGAVTSGTWLLASPKELRAQKIKGLDRCCDMRPARLQQQLTGVLPVDWLYFEDVQFLSTQLQAQLWASLRAVLTLLYPTIQIRAVPVGTLKKFATGHGNATKEDMADALDSYLPKMDDNEVDALHLLNFARNELKV